MSSMQRIAAFVFTTALLTAGALAQQPPAVQAQPTKPVHAQVSPEPITVPLSVGTAFNATLTTPLDATKTTSGDRIEAETAETVSYERSVIFPKGTRIIGHVVRAAPDARGGSAMFVQFDMAILKNGQQVLMNAGIQAIFTGPNKQASADADGGKAGVDARTYNSRAGKSYPVAGAVAANAATGTVMELSGTPEGARRMTYRPPQGSLPITQGAFTKSGLLTPDSQGALGSPDIKIYTPTSPGSDGTVLLSAKDNVHLEPGTRLLLVIQPPASVDSN